MRVGDRGIGEGRLRGGPKAGAAFSEPVDDGGVRVEFSAKSKQLRANKFCFLRLPT
jgi:hypothetical protein